MGGFVASTRLAGDLARLVQAALGWIPGGSALACVITGAIFANISGSAIADTAAIGSIYIPEMKRQGYPPQEAAALQAAAGVVGVVFQPAIAMILFSSVAQINVVPVFEAVIIPGLLIVLGQALVTLWRARRIPEVAGHTTPFSIGETLRSLPRASIVLLIPVILDVGILSGVFTPAESGAVAIVVTTVLLGLSARRDLRTLGRGFEAAVNNTSTVMFILISVSIINYGFSVSNVGTSLDTWLGSVTDHPLLLLLVINLIFAVVHEFVDAGPTILVLVPLILPAVTLAHVSLLQLAAVIAINSTIGAILPPVGVSLYVSAGIAGVSPGRLHAPDRELRPQFRGRPGPGDRDPAAQHLAARADEVTPLPTSERRAVIKAVAATGALGTGFKAETLARAAEGADFIGCDAGSSDPGPYYLGSGQMLASPAALSRDLELMIAAGLEHRIPVLVGSAGTAGARPQLERTVEIVRQLAARNGWHFKLAIIDSEIAPETVAEAFKDGKLIPLGGAPDIDEASIMAAAHIVAMQGPDCFIDALSQGADVVIAGRTSDTAIYAAIPIMRGIPKGIAFHAAKILECGAASTVERKYPDSMVGYVDHESFTVEPPNPDMYCTPQSVASHVLYETANPFRLVEPDGVMDTEHSQYEAVSDRAVRVTGSQFERRPDLHGQAGGGHRAGLPGGRVRGHPRSAGHRPGRPLHRRHPGGHHPEDPRQPRG